MLESDLRDTGISLATMLVQAATGATGASGESGAALDEAAVALAEREGLAALLGARALAGEVRVTHPELTRRLVAAHLSCVARETHFDAGLAKLLALWRPQGIRVLLLKGMALRRRVYPLPGSRPMADADLLVARDRWHEAFALAAAAGLRVEPIARRPLATRFHFERWLELEAATFDVHRRVTPRLLFADRPEEMIASAAAEPDGALVPDAAHLFVSLAVHAAQHGFIVGLRPLVDGLLTARRLGPAPQEVATVARAWKARRAVALWILALRRVGLEKSGWDDIARELVPALTGPVLIGQAIPLVASSTYRRRVWQLRTLRALVVDNPLRALAHYAIRGSLRGVDWLWARSRGGARDAAPPTSSDRT